MADPAGHHHHPKHEPTDWEATMHRQGMRMTHQRKAMLEVLGGDCNPLSAEAIREEVGKDQIDLATVYRSLEAFEKAGLIRRVRLESGKALFEINAGDHHHHHVICRQCGTVKALDACVVEPIEQELVKAGYRDLDHALEFFGTCPACAAIEPPE
ncbi:MAG: Fur family transcriptional regulator [Opitutales bacterium]